jgi:hypothetical protein
MTTGDQIAPTRAHHSSAYARNKALNEELHDRQLHSARRLSGSGPWLLVCECGDEACAETLELSEVEYEAVRSHPRLYAVASGHDLAAPSSLVTSVGRRFALVELWESAV